MSANLLSRHAECYFWLARYLERAESLARILEAQTSFQRSGSGRNSWAWIVALYSDQDDFAKKFDEPTAQNVINYYVTWLENPSSIQSCVRSARENARAIRPLISSDVWMQINDFYSRVMGLTEADFSENRLSRSCDSIKRGCYAEIGVAESTLYRDGPVRWWRASRRSLRRAHRADLLAPCRTARHPRLPSRWSRRRAARRGAGDHH
jgi:uncharacterized alpha-E superfamily protein